MAPAPYVPLGRVIKTHGLKGEVSVAFATDLPFVALEAIEVWFVPPPAGARTGRIESVRNGPKGPLVKIAGIDDIDTAATLCGRDLLVREADLPAGWDEEYDLEPDLVGFAVHDLVRGDLGCITEVIVTGANDVWVVEGPYGEVLLPVIDDVVLDLDADARTARVRLLPGLMPDEGSES